MHSTSFLVFVALTNAFTIQDVLNNHVIKVEDASVYGQPHVFEDGTSVVVINNTAYVQNNNISCYFINMDRSVDRLQHMQKQLSNQKLPLFVQLCERFPGPLVSEKATYLGKGELGCWMGHYGIWKRSTTTWTLIFEDDVVLDDQCQWNKMVSLNNRYDFYHLDKKTYPKYGTHAILIQTSKFRHRL